MSSSAGVAASASSNNTGSSSTKCTQPNKRKRVAATTSAVAQGGNTETVTSSSSQNDGSAFKRASTAAAVAETTTSVPPTAAAAAVILTTTTNSTTYGRCPNVSGRYEKVGRIGEGTYGIVYKALDKESGKHVALKRCIPHHESSDGFPLTTLREIQALRLCQGHPNVVKLLEVAVSKSGVFLVFEYCDNDLAQLMDAHYAKTNKSPFTLPQVKRLVQQLLSALAYLHERHMIHRDIKLSNLLYKAGSLRLADFGLARKYYAEATLTPKVVSLWYRPPELLLGSPVYTLSVDLWAAGCAFGELLQGYPLMAGQNEMEQLEQIFTFLGPPPPHLHQPLADLPLVRNGTIQLPSTTTTTTTTKASASSSSSLTRKVVLDRFAYLPHAGLYILTNLLHYDPSQRWTAKQALQNTSFFEEAPLPTCLDHMPKFKTVV